MAAISAGRIATRKRARAISNMPSARCRGHIDLSGLRVVLDCANGAAYKVAPMALWELGAEVFTIGVEPDGFNINHKVGSTAPEAVAAKVKEVRADIGIALDGDADRVIIIDEKGDVVDGDQFMAVIAQSWLAREMLLGGGIVATVMSNLGLERYLALDRADAGAHPGGRPLCAGSHAGQGLQCGRRAVGPHHPVRFHHHGRRAGGGAAIAGGAQGSGSGRFRRSARASRRCRSCCAACASRSGKPLEHKLVVQAIADGQAHAGHWRAAGDPRVRAPSR